MIKEPLSAEERREIICHVFGVDSVEDLPAVEDGNFDSEIECPLGKKLQLHSGENFDRIFLSYYKEIDNLTMAFGLGDTLVSYEISYNFVENDGVGEVEFIGQTAPTRTGTTNKGASHSIKYRDDGSRGRAGREFLVQTDNYLSLLSSVPQEACEILSKDHPLNEGAHFFDKNQDNGKGPGWLR